MMVFPTRRLALAIAVASPLWFLSATPLGVLPAVAAIAVIVACVILDLVRLPAASRFDIEREIPPASPLGEEMAVSYRVTSHWRAAAKVRITELFPDGLAEPVWRESCVTVPAFGDVTASITATPRRRGIHNLELIGIRFDSPFGLIQRTQRRSLPVSVKVAPSLAAAGRYRLLTLQHRLRLAGAHPLRRRGAGMAFSNLREYVVGDDPRFIDWKHTARRGKVISREYTDERGQSLLIAVDAGRMMTEIAGDRSRFELALSSALAVASVAVSMGDKVGLIVFDDVIRASVAPVAGPRALRAFSDAVVGVSPTMSEPDYALAFARMSSQQRSRSLIVFYTDVIDPRASRAMISNTVRGAIRHLPLVIALRNDALFSAAELPSEPTSASVYRSAAAEELIQARMEALQKMRDAGVLVADVSPRGMTPTVINRYLEIKARALL